MSKRECIVESVYFEKPGPENTARTLEIANRRAKELGIKSIVVATTTGATGVAATKVFPDSNLVVVTHATGFREPNVQELTAENRAALLAAGAKILTCSHAFGGVGRAVRRKLGTYEIEELVAFTLRTFGEGVKVALEITAMAADAGLIRCDEEIIAVAGTGRGADTALVIKPAHLQDFFDMRVVEILCKPRLGLL